MTVSNHGTIFLFEPRTEAAKEWIMENVVGETTYFDFGEGWCGGISSTSTATLRLRNSWGSESSVSSTTLTKCSRFIVHPLKEGAGSL